MSATALGQSPVGVRAHSCMCVFVCVRKTCFLVIGRICSLSLEGQLCHVQSDNLLSEEQQWRQTSITKKKEGGGPPPHKANLNTIQWEQNIQCAKCLIRAQGEQQSKPHFRADKLAEENLPLLHCEQLWQQPYPGIENVITFICGNTAESFRRLTAAPDLINWPRRGESAAALMPY